jgi:CheY-like chemotaxis protein
MVKKGGKGYYDVVFMDIQMPRMNGYEATREIRKLENGAGKDVPIIAMTANAFAEDVQMAMSAGMNEHVPKPLDLKSLAGILKKWVLS